MILAKSFDAAGLFWLAGIVFSLITVVSPSYALSIAVFDLTPRPPTFTDVDGNKITTTEAGGKSL